MPLPRRSALPAAQIGIVSLPNAGDGAEQGTRNLDFAYTGKPETAGFHALSLLNTFGHPFILPTPIRRDQVG